MGTKRTLDLALSKLCQSQFLRSSGPDKKFVFDSNGIKLMKKFQHCLTADKIDLRRVYSDDEAENVLRNGQSAIQIPDNIIENLVLKEKNRICFFNPDFVILQIFSSSEQENIRF